MKQQMLIDLGTISLENEELEKIEYRRLIEYFISKNTKNVVI
jgi:hypothetical protein